MIRLLDCYLLLVMLPAVIAGILVAWQVYVSEPAYVSISCLAFFIPIALISAFVLYWNRRYYDSMSFHLSHDEVVVEHGVWWKMKHTVPYARIMSVDMVQGPISRSLGIATVDIYTAGYTGVAGGTTGPSKRRAEASIMHISEFKEVRENILSIVRGRPLFTATTRDAQTEMLSELRRMRELLEKSSKEQ